MTTDKAREALREIVDHSDHECSAGCMASNLKLIRRLAEAALADEGEGEVWTVRGANVHGPNTLFIACTDEGMAQRVAAVPRLERIERAALAFRDACRVGFFAASDEFRALDRALNEEPQS